MAPNSLLFFACVAAACLVNYALPRKLRYLWLAVCSFAFYWFAAADVELNTPSVLMRLGLGPTMPGVVPAFCLLLGLCLSGWLLCLIMDGAAAPALRAVLLALCLAAPLAAWAGCKYLGLLGFFRPYSPGILAEGQPASGLALPLGLSFVTLQSLGYALDVYARRAPAEKNPLRYAAFVAFFPAVTAGPVNRAAQFMPQLKAPARFDYGRVAGGAFRILWGVFKKSVIADSLLAYTAPVFRNPSLYTGPMLVLGLLLFALQLYADFSGLCDIAAGAARMLGLENAENFRLPFGARSMAEFWRRWCCSMLGVLRDAVITPLRAALDKRPALARARKPLLAAALPAVFLLFAAWHGLEAEYYLFGAANAALVLAALALEKPKDRLAAKLPLYRSARLRGVFQRAMVYLLFCATLLLFVSAVNRQPLAGWAPRLWLGWESLTNGSLWPTVAERGLTLKLFLAAMGGAALMFGVEGFALRNGGSIADWIRRRHFLWRWLLYYGLITALVFFGVFGGAKGFYANF